MSWHPLIENLTHPFNKDRIAQWAYWGPNMSLDTFSCQKYSSTFKNSILCISLACRRINFPISAHAEWNNNVKWITHFYDELSATVNVTTGDLQWLDFGKMLKANFRFTSNSVVICKTECKIFFGPENNGIYMTDNSWLLFLVSSQMSFDGTFSIME